MATTKEKIKLRTVNVIEIRMIESTVEAIFSFADTKKGNKAAEKQFAKLCRYNWKQNANKEPLTQEDIDSALEDGYFETGDSKIIIEHGI